MCSVHSSVGAASRTSSGSRSPASASSKTSTLKLALLARRGTEPRQRMLGVAAVAEERAQQPSIVLHDVDLGVQRRAQPVAKVSAM